MVQTRAKKLGKSPRGSAYWCQNVFFSHATTYPAPISTIFETKDVNWCARVYTVKIAEFQCCWFYRPQK